jgi:protein gp37
MLPPDWGAGYQNVWLGVTAENMVEVGRRIPLLFRVPSVRYFACCEPLFEHVDLTPWLGDDKVSWVICGGETGKKRRALDPAWMRSLRDQCAGNGVAFWCKQMSAPGWKQASAMVPPDLRVHQFPIERQRKSA